MLQGCSPALAKPHEPAWLTPTVCKNRALLLSACSLCLDSRAKVRRAAQSAVGDVLAGLQPSPASLAQASESILKLCQRVLPGPEAAAHAAAAAASKKRQQAEEAIAAAVADALHLLGALKQWIALLSGARQRALHMLAHMHAFCTLSRSVTNPVDLVSFRGSL